jgi:hypothetical protein
LDQELPEGTVTVSVTKDDYETDQKPETVEIKANETKTITFKFRVSQRLLRMLVLTYQAGCSKR